MTSRAACFALLTGLALTLTACGSTVQIQGSALPGQQDGVGEQQGLVGDGVAPGVPDAISEGAPSDGSGSGSGADPTAGTAVAGVANLPGSGSTTREPAGSGTTSARPGASPTRVAKGFGFDEKTVFIGVTLSSDGNKAAESFGLNSVDGGDQVAQARAMAKYYNARGGILGRKVEFRFSDHSSASLTTQADTEAQAVCEQFTRDQPVVAVINTQTLLDTPNLRACLKNKGLPLFGVSITAIDDRVLQESAGLYFPTLTPTWTRFAPVFVKSLAERRFFTGWDTRAAAPGPAPVKVGAFIHDDPVTQRAYEQMAAALKAAGHPVNEVVKYGDVASGGSAAVLRFSSTGVTHVFSLDPNVFTLATAAESQGYRPRYALSTANGPGLLFEANAPKQQSYGALAVGTAPSLDLLGFPGEVTAGGKICRDIFKADGQTFGSGKRFAEAFAFSICDSVRLLAEASTAGNGFGRDAFLIGAGKVGPTFKTAAAYATGLQPGYPVLPGVARDIAYLKSCSCFKLDGSRVRKL